MSTDSLFVEKVRDVVGLYLTTGSRLTPTGLDREGSWLLGLVGLLSIAFAVMLAITPGAGALVITWLIAWYAIIVGVLLLALSWRLRKLQSTVEERVTSAWHASA